VAGNAEEFASRAVMTARATRPIGVSGTNPDEHARRLAELWRQVRAAHRARYASGPPNYRRGYADGLLAALVTMTGLSRQAVRERLEQEA